jgi:Zn-finger nucleic acid-binding protein
MCNACKDEIVSIHRHDFNSCKCGAIAIDGGLEYTRRVGDIHNYTDLSVYEDAEREETDWEREYREREEKRVYKETLLKTYKHTGELE